MGAKSYGRDPTLFAFLKTLTASVETSLGIRENAAINSSMTQEQIGRLNQLIEVVVIAEISASRAARMDQYIADAKQAKIDARANLNAFIEKFKEVEGPQGEDVEVEAR